jgi:hypothetical protein
MLSIRRRKLEDVGESGLGKSVMEFYKYAKIKLSGKLLDYILLAEVSEEICKKIGFDREEDQSSTERKDLIIFAALELIERGLIDHFSSDYEYMIDKNIEAFVPIEAIRNKYLASIGLIRIGAKSDLYSQIDEKEAEKRSCA